MFKIDCIENCSDRLTLLIPGKNPDLNVGQREESNGFWDTFLQLVLYSSGT